MTEPVHRGEYSVDRPATRADFDKILSDAGKLEDGEAVLFCPQCGTAAHQVSYVRTSSGSGVIRLQCMNGCPLVSSIRVAP